MPRLHRLISAVVTLSTGAFAGATARADVVWSPQTGWSIEGGVLSGMTEAETKNAVELMNTAKRLEDNGSYHTAARYYERVADRFPNSVYSPEALYRAGHAYLLKKEYYKSFDAYQKTLAFYPNTNRFLEVVGEQFRISSALMDGARNRILRGTIPGFKNPERAVGYFEAILASAPFSDYAPLALMNVAEAHLKFDEIEEAIDSLNRMINTYPNNVLTPDAYLKLGRTHASLVGGPEYDQGDTREAITYLTDFLIRFPNDPNAAEAEKLLGEMRSSMAQSKIKMGDFYFYKRSNYTAARVFYNEAITAAAGVGAPPGSADEKIARDRLAELEAKVSGVPVPANAQTAPVEKRRKRFLFF